MRNANSHHNPPDDLLVLDLTDFRAFAAGHPELARAVESGAQRRLHHADDPFDGQSERTDRSEEFTGKVIG